jgi:hypothetical protein
VARRFGLVLDANDPERLAGFWTLALDYARADRQEPDGLWIYDPDRGGPPIFIQRVPEPKTAKNRLHLDIHTSGGGGFDERRARLEAAAERLIAAGATFAARSDDPDDYFVVLRDPEGNEFCVV